ncbi:MAG: hypothetical protein C0490_26225, partial [Marivirga sp.]|nr:hypothetical protein [Marivirga sp.]
RLIAYEGIKDAVVAVKQNADNKYLVGYYVSEEDLVSTELYNYLSEYLPDYMVPVHYIRMASFPLAPSGKIDRGNLPHPQFTTEQDYMAPSNEIEDSLVTIWSDVLKVDRKNISTNRSFFELGGNSLNVLSLNTKMEARLKTRITIPDLFRYPTIQALVRYLSRKEHTDDDSKMEMAVEASQMKDIVDDINNEQF